MHAVLHEAADAHRRCVAGTEPPVRFDGIPTMGGVQSFDHADEPGRCLLLVLRVAVELLQQLRRHSNLRLRRERVPSLHAGVPQAEGRGSLRRGQGAKAEAVQADDHD